jgi:sarcosine oxidase subunit beta
VARSFDVIVVGAGITGASTAYHLTQRGVGRVLMLERAEPAGGGTGKSAAIVRQHYSTPLMARLAKASVDMLAAMPKELGASGGYVASGYHFLAPPPLWAAAEKNAAMQRQCGVRTERVEPGQWAERLSWLNPEGVAGILFEPEGGYADPIATTEAYVAAFKSKGGELRTKTPVRGLLREGDAIAGVLLDEGPIAAGAVVNAAGTWAHFLARGAGIEMQLRTVREQDTVWEARPGRPIPPGSVSNAVDAIYIRPLGERRYVVGRGFPKDYVDVDPYNFKETADDDFVADVQARMERRVPGFAGARLIHAYAALYDVTVDWYPYIGPRRGLKGYYDACGGSGHGFKIGPAIGRELAGWIASGSAAEDFAALSYDRIAAGRLFNQSYGGNRG